MWSDAIPLEVMAFRWLLKIIAQTVLREIVEEHIDAVIVIVIFFVLWIGVLWRMRVCGYTFSRTSHYNFHVSDLEIENCIPRFNPSLKIISVKLVITLLLMRSEWTISSYNAISSHTFFTSQVIGVRGVRSCGVLFLKSSVSLIQVRTVYRVNCSWKSFVSL